MILNSIIRFFRSKLKLTAADRLRDGTVNLIVAEDTRSAKAMSSPGDMVVLANLDFDMGIAPIAYSITDNGLFERIVWTLGDNGQPVSPEIYASLWAAYRMAR